MFPNQWYTYAQRSTGTKLKHTSITLSQETLQVKDMLPVPGDRYQQLQQGWQTQERTGSLQSPQKFNNQDFTHLRAYCLSRGLLFVDDTFPADVSSIGPNLLSEDKLSRIQWKRPTMIERDPHLIMDGVSRFDIVQGEIGDCWVLAALGSLTLQRQFLENVLPKDQGFQHNYAGIFHFRFWHFGDWVDVVIDDRLPFLNGRYLSVQPRSRNEFWPSLLEKAYAKLRSSYQNLHWGYLSDALVDLTGGIQVQFLLQQPSFDLQEMAKAAAKSQCLMGCTTVGGQSPGNIELKNGLVKGHAYTVTGATEIPYRNGSEDIIRVWNPWGHGEWKGPWSDRSPQWDGVPPEYKRKLCEDKDDGEFWISRQDFVKQFFSLCICNITPSFLDFGDQRGTSWTMATYVNQWVRGLTAGGRNYRNGTFSRNPQYFIQMEEPDLKNYNVVVSLMQKPANNMPYVQKLLIGFLIFRVEPKFQDLRDRLPVAFFSQHKSKVLEYGFTTPTRDVTHYFCLSPGTYVVVPATSEEGQEAEFLLRIFLRCQNYNDELKSRLSPVMPKDQDVPKQTQNNSFENIFLRYAKQGSDMDASQLQRLLNEVFLRDLTASQGREFSFDSCRGILALMDLRSTGRLSLKEFKPLWKLLVKYEDIFRKEERAGSGFLGVSDLRNAVQRAGLAVNDELLHLIALRYGDSSMRTCLPDFVCCMIRFETMASVFRNLAKDGKISFTATEWLIFSMYC
ncbi:calpain-13 [Carettochelys insculpta]|uniref:calpain-13 n=1 Tax=Carettochelys insculpta TaxID=44489 RepID=UPI003EBDC206